MKITSFLNYLGTAQFNAGQQQFNKLPKGKWGSAHPPGRFYLLKHNFLGNRINISRLGLAMNYY